MADNLSLVIMTFPQRWNLATATLDVNAILIPSVNPVADPLLGGGSAIFAAHPPNLGAVIIPSLSTVPTRADPTAIRIAPVILDPNPVAPFQPNYDKLISQAGTKGITITGTGALTQAPQSSIRKALPQSYLNATGATPSGATATTHEFGCAIRGQKVSKAVKPQPTIGWGPMISYALRQPVLATALGLRYVMQIQLQDPTKLKTGSWVFIEIAESDPWVSGEIPSGPIRLYAARLPALTAARQVFAAQLFPVDAQGSIDDSAFSVAETYDDGFAQIVHVYQPQANDAVLGESSISAPTDIGVQIGWDDEQVLAWQNNQIQIMKARMSGPGLKAQTPLGVQGYRVDVADVTSNPPTPAWHSLVVASATLPQGFGKFDGELALEPTPVRPQPSPDGEAWLPRYFANWRGGSLAVREPVLPAMLTPASARQPVSLTPDPVGVLLSYGRTYMFRVRLADLSSGGPTVADNPVHVDPVDTAVIDFRRAVPPKKPGVQLNFSPTKPVGSYGSWPYVEPESLTFTRPLIGFPEVLYTGLGDTDAHRGQIIEYLIKIADPGTGVVAGLPDPDAETLALDVEVRTPLHDVAGDGVLDTPFRELYSTTRPFPPLPAGPLPQDPGLRIDIAYVDAPSIIDWAPKQPSNGPLVIPRGRDVRITARALTRDDPSYFLPVATTGLPASVIVRAELRREPSLLIRSVDGSSPLRAFLFKRPPGIVAPPVAAQLGQELGLAVDGLTFSAPPGHRIAFGASKSVRHTLPGDNSTITFAAESELLRQWIIVLMVDLERDWTWDGLGNANQAPANQPPPSGQPPSGTVAVQRNGVQVGSLVVARTLGAAAVADPANWDRHRTLLVFFDGVDPHEQTASGFPEALTHTWTINATTLVETGASVGVNGKPTLKQGAVPEPAEPELNGAPQSLTLPIAVPPVQIPEVASVGLALSPFAAGPGYASTANRERALWVEMKASVQNQVGDALFARIVGHGPDPLLYNAVPSTDKADEPPLILDPELMRMITPGESDNRAGLNAMTPMEQATDSKVHFRLPLPPGIDPSDPELFGFCTYEFRIGHAGDPQDQRWWSTAQARFGRPLRVTGFQHPAPPLVCEAGRLATDIIANSTYATPVLNGRPLVKPDELPKTELWFFLYAQVVQADAASNRNVLLFQRQGKFMIPDVSSSQRDRVGSALFFQAHIEKQLRAMGLPVDLPLSVLAVEFLPGGVGGDLPIPVVTGIDPKVGPSTGGTKVTITGKGFASVTSVAFGGAAATNVVHDANNPAKLAADSPPGNGTVDVRVTNPAGTSAATSADQFTYQFAAAITRVHPALNSAGALAVAAVQQDPDPLHLNTRPRRILRVSALVPVAAIC
jgi:hypothetical protein